MSHVFTWCSEPHRCTKPHRHLGRWKHFQMLDTKHNNNEVYKILNEWMRGGMIPLSNCGVWRRQYEDTSSILTINLLALVAGQNSSRLSGPVVFSVQTNGSRIWIEPSWDHLFEGIFGCFPSYQSVIVLFTYIQTNQAKGETQCLQTRCERTLKSILLLPPRWRSKMFF